MRRKPHVRFWRRVGRATSRLSLTQRVLHGGRFLTRLRTAYSERVVEEVTRRLRGTARRSVEGSLITVKVRF